MLSKSGMESEQWWAAVQGIVDASYATPWLHWIFVVHKTVVIFSLLTSALMPSRKGILSLDWNFWPRFFREFRKSSKMCKMNHFRLFCRLCLVVFLTLTMARRFYAAPPAPQSESATFLLYICIVYRGSLVTALIKLVSCCKHLKDRSVIVNFICVSYRVEGFFR